MRPSAVLVLATLAALLGAVSAGYNVGVGKSDVTGPIAEEGTMGYAKQGITTHGIHLRLFSRAFVVEDDALAPGTPGSVLAFVSADICMIFQGVKERVVEGLQERYPQAGFSYESVVLSGTHTHSAPGGFSWRVLYNLTTLGFNKKNFDTIVDGIVDSIGEAYESRKPGSMKHARGSLFGSSISRSSAAYLMNPEEERKQWEHEGDTDKTFDTLRFFHSSSSGDEDIGVFNWFSVHGTSMPNDNEYVSSDNKGYAANLWETSEARKGNGKYVAAFCQCNEGDVSPNTAGAFCDDGTPCGDSASSKCKKGWCNGHGPGTGWIDSTRIIAEKQVNKAQELFSKADATSSPLSGPIGARHTFVKMDEYTTRANNMTLCSPALGMSFAAGTTDGPGDFNFEQNDNHTSGNAFWDVIRDVLKDPSPELVACQLPKPIFVDAGEMHPYPWAPLTLPFQVARIGNFFIVAAPGELTTMSGRRVRASVEKALIESGIENPVVVISGLANSYSHYIATPEEFQMQRYEAASTLYGPNTLHAHIEVNYELAKALATNSTVKSAPAPPDLESKTFNVKPPVILDTHPWGKPFGTVVNQPQTNIGIGANVTAEFVCASPRNDYYTNESFLLIERMDSSSGEWVVDRTDTDPDTLLHWARHDISQSRCTITWMTGIATGIEKTHPTPGKYRMKLSGAAKKNPLSENHTRFHGTSEPFALLSNSDAAFLRGTNPK